MDAFFASVEQRDNPELLGKPIAVGGNKNRGVVAAASYEARKFGVKSAMPSVTAARLCPNIIFVPPRFEAYKEASLQIHEIFEQYTSLIEPLSLDEAFLDVTENKLGIETATEIAQLIKNDIKAKLNLNASAGVSYNKFLAKIASDMDKPNGLFVIPPSQALKFLEQLEVKKFFGVGKVTAKKMLKLGVVYGADLKKISKEILFQNFGKAGNSYYNLVRGEDDRPVNPNRERKSLGAESTFEKDIKTFPELKQKIILIAERVEKRLIKSNTKGYTITLKIKFSDFKQITRSKTFDTNFNDKDKIISSCFLLLKEVEDISLGIRLVGISLSNFKNKDLTTPQKSQLTLNF